MLIKDVKDGKYFTSLDETILCELLHPKNDIKAFKMNFSLAYAFLEPEKSSLPHKIKNSVEVYYILEGIGLMHVDDEIRKVKEGQAIYIPPNSIQYIENVGNSVLKILCIVSPPWKSENEELE